MTRLDRWGAPDRGLDHGHLSEKTFKNVTPLVRRMRLVKDAYEIAAMREAAEISGQVDDHGDASRQAGHERSRSRGTHGGRLEAGSGHARRVRADRRIRPERDDVLFAHGRELQRRGPRDARRRAAVHRLRRGRVRRMRPTSAGRCRCRANSRRTSASTTRSCSRRRRRRSTR